MDAGASSPNPPAATPTPARVPVPAPPDRERTIVSRPLLLAWSLWLLLSWAINLLIDATGFFSTLSIVPVTRGMLQSLLLGIGLIWPLWRLSMAGHRRVGAETAADLLAILLVTQIGVWPLRLVVGWEVVQAAMIVACITMTACAVALVVWWGRLARTGAGRALAMVVCALMLGGGWVWTWVTAMPASDHLSPLATVWAWTDSDHGDTGAAELARTLGAVAAAVVAGWVGTRIGQRLGRRRPVASGA